MAQINLLLKKHTQLKDPVIGWWVCSQLPCHDRPLRWYEVRVHRGMCVDFPSVFFFDVLFFVMNFYSHTMQPVTQLTLLILTQMTLPYVYVQNLEYNAHGKLLYIVVDHYTTMLTWSLFFQRYSSSRRLLLFYYCSSCYCFRAKGHFCCSLLCCSIKG